ncbi:Aste57867_23878 [Aphanomyces stellatus]|uniref:Aste57867_23878 protein n=1 Tax=Aphanomyces stellatus TaxID=120398 RepID=A0A485LQI1_9STRA|nr:hypothetical protein As57867_023805 [Aphanomyces stellatus]VFU00521.1 Aste57867_23878 [Aphanomyces stellatus]
MFGSTSTFGAAAQPAASTGFSFGQPANTPAAGSSSGGFSFGGASSTQPAAAAPSTGFGFGSSAQQPAGGGGGFSFGGAAPSSSTAGTTSTGAFGQAQPTPAAGSSLSSFSFGGSAPPSSTGGAFSFGGSQPAAASSAPAAGAFSFGQPAASTQPAAGSSSFSFGQPAAAPATGGAFSFGQPAASSGGGFGSGFGNTANKPTSAFGTSSFGSFGQPAAAAAPSSAFGFGGPAAAAAPSSAMNAAAFAAANSPMESLQGIKMAYTDPFQSRFKHMFYNAVDPAHKHLYTRPPHVGEKLWIQAQRDNPDPTNCVPAAVLGFKELATRIKLQQEHTQKFNGYAVDLVKQVQEMEKASRQTDVKLAHCRQQHIALFHRLVQLMRKLEVFKQLRKPLAADEHRLAMTLKHIQGLLDNPTQFKAHMHELMTLQSMQEAVQSQQRAENQQLTEDDMVTVFRLLDKQREGLEHLTKILNQDLRDVQIMKKALEDDE